jgi:hypothetical protein
MGLKTKRAGKVREVTRKVCTVAWNPAGAALGQKKTQAWRGDRFFSRNSLGEGLRKTTQGGKVLFGPESVPRNPLMVSYKARAFLFLYLPIFDQSIKQRWQVNLVSVYSDASDPSIPEYLTPIQPPNQLQQLN